MIYGIGNDILENYRIKKILDKKYSKRFLDKCFTKREIEYFELKKMSAMTICSYFCMKESILKALGIGFSVELGIDKLEILKDEYNKPYLLKNEYLDSFFYKRGVYNYNIHISCSHIEDYSIGMCVIEVF